MLSFRPGVRPPSCRLPPPPGCNPPASVTASRPLPPREKGAVEEARKGLEELKADTTNLVRHSPPLIMGPHITIYSATAPEGPVVIKEAVDDLGSLRLRREADFYREVGSRLDDVIQRALHIVRGRFGDIEHIVLEELGEKDGWVTLNYYSRLSREEAETLYFLLVKFHAESGGIHGRFGADSVFYRPSATPGQPGSFRLFDFGFVREHRNGGDCPGVSCGQLMHARVNLGLEQGIVCDEEVQFQGASLDVCRRIKRDRREAEEKYQDLYGEPMFPDEPDYYRKYDGPLDLTRRV